MILLIRNPFLALVSEWNRQIISKFKELPKSENPHVDVHNQTYFMDNLMWQQYVYGYITKWKKFFNWMVDIPEGHTILPIRYEDMKQNMTNEMRKVLKFLHYETTGILNDKCVTIILVS